MSLVAPLKAMVVWQGAVQPLYAVDATAVGATGVATVPAEFVVRTTTKLATVPVSWLAEA